MARYHVYGMGHALVDMEYEVDFADLQVLGLDKGVMTLGDESKQLEIELHLATRHHERASGGSAANTAIGLAQLGGKGFFSCKVADDELGHFYMRDLIEGGIDTNHHTEKDQGHTGRCVVLSTPDTDRTMCTFLGVAGNVTGAEVVAEALRDSDWFYMEGYLVTSPVARASLIEARKVAESAGVRTALSLSDPNIVKYFKDGLMEMIGTGVDLIFANESEAKGMAGTDDLGTAFEYLKAMGRELAITRGAKGALLWDGERMVEVPGNRVGAVDTLGAGDMFAGAYLYGISKGWTRSRAGDLAAAASAKVVTVLGPRISRDETQAVLARFA